MNLRKFRKENNLTQEQVGDYVEMSKGFVSRIETGKEKMPEIKLTKLLQNDMGWDVSALLEDSAPITINNLNKSSQGDNSPVTINEINKETADILQGIATMKSELESLRVQLAEEKARSAKYWEMIETLMKR